jgi:Outer membrane protein beta-barrel domain
VRPVRIAAFVMCALTAASAPTRAEGFFIPYLGYNYGGDSANCKSLTDCQEKHANYGVAIGGTGKVIGFEQDIGWAKGFFAEVPGTDNSVFVLMSNVMIGLLTGPVQPYVVGGFGLIRTHVSLSPIQIGLSNNSLGYDLGFGLAGYFTRHVGVRGDFRRFHTLQDVEIPGLGGLVGNDKLDYWRGSLGLAFKF